MDMGSLESLNYVQNKAELSSSIQYAVENDIKGLHDSGGSAVAAIAHRIAQWVSIWVHSATTD